ncbi:MAG: hypothetical protein F6K19_40590 [Cyanothece sp. SIO1E1]|nr:hypothetical protein [Cyanothece sp. SIO1E1]
MVTLNESPQQLDVSQGLDDLDALKVPEPKRGNPLWNAIASTAKRAHQAWEQGLEEGMNNHQKAVDGAIEGARNFLNNSVETANNALKTAADEAKAGTAIVRNTLATKAANDELQRDLKLNESSLGASSAISREERLQLNEIARAEHRTIQDDSARRLEATFTKNENLASNRSEINSELQAIGTTSVDATSKLRMDLNATKAKVEQMNREGQPVDVAKVFSQVRAADSNPERDRSQVVSLLVGQGQPTEDRTAIPNAAPVQPEPKLAIVPETSADHQEVSPGPGTEPDYSETRGKLSQLSKTRLQRIARTINGDSQVQDKIAGINHMGKEQLLEVLGNSERLSFLTQNPDIIADNTPTKTAASSMKRSPSRRA